eukprot:Nk52_evm15s312 gene=Nk52_evmTU15s312
MASRTRSTEREEERVVRNLKSVGSKEEEGEEEGRDGVGQKEESDQVGEEVEYTRNQKISLSLNNLITLNSGVAFALFNPILYDYVSGMGVSGTFYSDLGLAYGLAAIASNLIVAFYGNSPWFPRFKILYMISLVMNVCAGLMFSVVGNPYLVLGSKILTGLASYAQSSTKVYVSAMTTPANRTEHQNRLTMYTFISNLTTPILSFCFLYIDSRTEVMPMNKYTLTGWFLVLFSLVLMVLTAVYFEEPKVASSLSVRRGSVASKQSQGGDEKDKEEEVDAGVKVIAARRRSSFEKAEGFFAQFPWVVFFLTLYGRFLQYFGDAVFQTAAPVVLKDDLQFGNTLNVDLLFLIYGSAYYFFSLPITMAIKKFGYRALILVGSIGLGFSFLLTIQFTSGSTIRKEGAAFYIYCFQVVIGSIMTAFGCVLLAQASGSLLSICVGKQKQQSFAMGLYVVVGFLGRLVGSYWGGMDKYVGGFNTIFLVSLGIAVAGFIMFISWYRKLDETVYSKMH